MAYITIAIQGPPHAGAMFFPIPPIPLISFAIFPQELSLPLFPIIGKPSDILSNVVHLYPLLLLVVLIRTLKQVVMLDGDSQALLAVVVELAEV